MAGAMTIELRQLRFYAYHGVYAEERKTGNEFEINLSVTFEPAGEQVKDIGATINYAELVSLVKEQMKQPVGLLETLATGLAAQIKISFPQTKRIRISIAKLHPPIEQFNGQVGVTWERIY